MSARFHFTQSIKFASFVALVVALGTQLLLDSVIPAFAFDWLEGRPISGYRIAGASYWMGDSVIRLLAFGFGAAVACLLASARSKRLLVSLVLLSLMATVFAQFPKTGASWQLLIWVLSGPLGVFLVGLLMARRGRAAT